MTTRDLGAVCTLQTTVNLWELMMQKISHCHAPSVDAKSYQASY